METPLVAAAAEAEIILGASRCNSATDARVAVQCVAPVHGAPLVSVPAAHFVHRALPSELLNHPFLHDSHAVAPGSEKRPGGHTAPHAEWTWRAERL